MKLKVNKIKLIISMLLLLVMVNQVNHQTEVNAKFGFSSSRSSSSGFHFSSPSSPSSSSSSSSRVGTFRNQTNSRNSILNRTQSNVNSRTTSYSNRGYNNRYGGYGYANHGGFFGSFMGGMFGGMIARSMFGGYGYSSGAYYEGPGMIFSWIINIIITIIMLVIIVKIIGFFFRNRTNTYDDYGQDFDFDDSEQIVRENNRDFENQKIDLTRQDAKNYIQNLPLNAQEKLDHISKIESFSSEDAIVNYVEDVERSLDSQINISLSEGKKQALDYVNNTMTWISPQQNISICEKIESARTLQEIENAIAPFDK